MGDSIDTLFTDEPREEQRADNRRHLQAVAEMERGLNYCLRGGVAGMALGVLVGVGLGELMLYSGQIAQELRMAADCTLGAAATMVVTPFSVLFGGIYGIKTTPAVEHSGPPRM